MCCLSGRAGHPSPRLVSRIVGDIMFLLSQEDSALLKELCNNHRVPHEVVLELLQTEGDLDGMGRRHGLYERIGEILERAVKTEG